MIIWITILLLVSWGGLIWLGRWFAVRDPLQKVDVVVCLAGTRGKLQTLHDRLDTALHLLQKGCARWCIVTGAFSGKTGDRSQVSFTEEEISRYITEGRIPFGSKAFALSYWDKGLDAQYMKTYLIKNGCPSDRIIVENQSLTTKENFMFIMPILQERGWKSMFLVTSPFHQRRAFRAFSTGLKENEIHIFNYAAHSEKWNPLFWWAWPENWHTVYREVLSQFVFYESGEPFVSRNKTGKRNER